MRRRKIVWQPRYAVTLAIAGDLMAIEAARAVVARIPLPPAAEAELRRQARLRSVHYSTRIEGNLLTLAGVFSAAREEAQRYEEPPPDAADPWRGLDHRARVVAALFD